jgi:hypothetical protein
LVLASHPLFSKWREIFEAKFLHLQALNLDWLHLVGAKNWQSGAGWVHNGLVSLTNKTGWFHLMAMVQ